MGSSTTPFRIVSIPLLSLGDPAFQISGSEGAWLGDQLPSRIHLTPDVPQKHPEYPCVSEIVNHAFAVRFFPVLDGLQARVQLTNSFIPEVKQIRIEEGKVMVRARLACH